MPRYAFEFLERRFDRTLNGAKVLLLGVSYRGDVGDTRFSPVEPFYRCLYTAGANISAHDPFVLEWCETNIKPAAEIDEALKIEPDIAVISSGHTIYQQDKTIETFLTCKAMWIYDTIGLLSEKHIKTLQQKHTVIVLGRGDL
jgi:UDP-N-acetyl-D-mannosaminuronate dehydrogenase